MDITKKLAGSALAASLILGGASIAFAQTNTGTGTTYTTGTSATTTGTGGTTGTPSTPNTGAGGDAATNMGLLATAGVLAVGSGLYMTRRKVA